MFRKTWLLIYILCFLVNLTSCNSITFTQSEQTLIDGDDDIMQLFVIGDMLQETVLRKKANPLSGPDIHSDMFEKLKQRMLLTVNDTANKGVGIAAPQVGVSKKLIAVQRFDKPYNPFEFFANPVIVKSSNEKLPGMEGCLSVPGMRGKVMRSSTIIVRFTDCSTLLPVEEEISGFTAVIFQHEIDHLDGVLFIDKMETKEKPAIE